MLYFMGSIASPEFYSSHQVHMFDIGVAFLGTPPILAAGLFVSRCFLVDVFFY